MPIDETIGAIAEMIQAGFVRQGWASRKRGPRRSAAPKRCTRSPTCRSLSRGIEDEILPACRELGVGITAYGVLSRGLLSGHWSAERTATAGPLRQTAPRFTGENLERNLALVEALRLVADGRGASVAHLAIAWVLSRGEDVVPLVGALRRDQLAEALGAVDLELSPEDLEAIERAVPRGAAAGERYQPPQMASLDSERGTAAGRWITVRAGTEGIDR